MPNDYPPAPGFEPNVGAAALVGAAFLGVLMWVVCADESPLMMRSELIVVLLLAALATAIAGAALYARGRFAQQLESAAERFIVLRDGHVHAGMAWIASFTVMTAAVVALSVSRHNGPKAGAEARTGSPLCPELPEHRVIACCHDRVRGVCEPCPTSRFCAEHGRDVPVTDR
jgi:hypothetical protein